MKATKADIKNAVTTAKELQYSKEVIEKIKQAKTDGEIYRILRTAREHSTW